MIAPLDYGRCYSLSGVPKEDQGDMFMIQPTGKTSFKADSAQLCCQKPATNFYCGIMEGHPAA